MRYLGKIAEMLRKVGYLFIVISSISTLIVPQVPQLEYVHVLAVSELVMRSAKHLFTLYLQVATKQHTIYIYTHS